MSCKTFNPTTRLDVRALYSDIKRNDCYIFMTKYVTLRFIHTLVLIDV